MHVTLLLFLCEVIELDLPSESHLRRSKQLRSLAMLSWPLLGDSAVPGTKHLGRSHDSVFEVAFWIAGARRGAPTCGDDLARANIMKQDENLENLTFGMRLPGIAVNTSPNDYAPVKQFQMVRFDGEHLVPFGSIISGEIAGK